MSMTGGLQALTEDGWAIETHTSSGTDLGAVTKEINETVFDLQKNGGRVFDVRYVPDNGSFLGYIVFAWRTDQRDKPVDPG